MTTYNKFPFTGMLSTAGYIDLFNELFGIEKNADECKCDYKKACKCRDEDKEAENADANTKFTIADRNRILKYTGEDFKDDGKLNEFLDVTDSIIEEFDSLPSYVKSLINLTLGYAFSEKVAKCQDDAVAVNVAEKNSLRQKAKENTLRDTVTENKQAKTKTRELSEKYVDTVVTELYNKSNSVLSDKERKNIIDVYDDFANWILKQ